VPFANKDESQPETQVASSTPRSNPGLILGVALSITLGVMMGLPLIYRKNGLGLLVVLIVSVFAATTISLVAKREHPARTVDLPQSKLRVRIRPLWSPVSCAIGGSLIAVIGGIVTHYVSPMHPLDVLSNLTALALLGAFAGSVVGTTLLFAMNFSQRYTTHS
jgi:hypothetical protein